MHPTNIDVTLRDGGYRNSFDFELDYVLTHVKASVDAGFDWVEVGYRNGSFKPMFPLGLTGRGEDSLISAVANEIGPDHVGLILHPRNIGPEDIPAMYRAGARLLRVCVATGNPGPALDSIRQAKDTGFVVCGNLTRVSHLETGRVAEIVGEVSNAGADTVYLADSNGSLLPDQVTRLTALCVSIAPVAIGLHAHNNLGLALSNSLAAVSAGATWIDSSFLGMGKGPGNLCAEQWIAYLHRVDPTAQYDLGAALHLADLLGKRVPESAPCLPLPDLVLGRFDLPAEARSSILAEDHRQLVRVAQLLAAGESSSARPTLVKSSR